MKKLQLVKKIAPDLTEEMVKRYRVLKTVRLLQPCGRRMVVLSLGMVGALSIVRFRTAIKEPLDIAYLFWAIAVGIVLAAGLIPLAVIGSVVIGVVLLGILEQRPCGNDPRGGGRKQRRGGADRRGN